jgi:hypothetical protein
MGYGRFKQKISPTSDAVQMVPLTPLFLRPVLLLQPRERPTFDQPKAYTCSLELPSFCSAEHEKVWVNIYCFQCLRAIKAGIALTSRRSLDADACQARASLARRPTAYKRGGPLSRAMACLQYLRSSMSFMSRFWHESSQSELRKVSRSSQRPQFAFFLRSTAKK